MTETYASPEQVAQILGVHRKLVYKLVQTGQLRHVRVGCRTIRIPLSALNSLHLGGTQ